MSGSNSIPVCQQVISYTINYYAVLSTITMHNGMSQHVLSIECLPPCPTLYHGCTYRALPLVLASKESKALMRASNSSCSRRICSSLASASSISCLFCVHARGLSMLMPCERLHLPTWAPAGQPPARGRPHRQTNRSQISSPSAHITRHDMSSLPQRLCKCIAQGVHLAAVPSHILSAGCRQLPRLQLPGQEGLCNGLPVSHVVTP